MRDPNNSALAQGWLKRAIRRQVWMCALIVLAFIAIGAAIDYYAGLSWLNLVEVWLVAGVAAALIAALVRELSRNTINSVATLRKHRGYVVLGAAPELTERALRKLPPDKRTPVGCLAYQPASTFAAAFRDLQAALEGHRVVAFIGPSANEGATTAALSTAISAQQQGRNVVLVDCDLRRRSLSRLLDDDTNFGLLEASREPAQWRHALRQEDDTGLFIIPVARARNPWGSLADSPGFRELLGELRANFDLVVLDCPPALTVADGAVIARLADKCVLVAAWDETPLLAVRTAMGALRRRSREAPPLYINRVPARYQFERQGY